MLHPWKSSGHVHKFEYLIKALWKEWYEIDIAGSRSDETWWFKSKPECIQGLVNQTLWLTLDVLFR